MDIASASIAGITAYASHHALLVYTLLFLGSYLETIIGINFILRGEILFIGGGILAGAGVLDPVIVTFLAIVGSILGDHTSYWIGRTYGNSLFKEGRWILNPKNRKKGEHVFNKFGAKAVFIARLLGPLTWIMPFIAGVYKVKYREFLPFNILGVVVGVGQLLLIGYLFGAHYQKILSLQTNYVGIALITIAAVFVLYHLFKARGFEYLVRMKAKFGSTR